MSEDRIINPEIEDLGEERLEYQPNNQKMLKILENFIENI